MKSSSAARSSAAASFVDFLLPAVGVDFDPFLAGGVDSSLFSDAFAFADGAGVFSLPAPAGVFVAAGAAAAVASAGAGDGDDADVVAAAGVSVFLAGGGVFAAAAAAAAGTTFLAEAGGAVAVFLTPFSDAPTFVAADALDGAGTAAAGGDAAGAAGAGLAEDKEPTVEVDVADEGDGAAPPLLVEDSFLAGGASDGAPVVAAEAACESSRASLTRF